MNCFFCLEEVAAHKDGPFMLCPKCFKERKDVAERADVPVTDEPKRDVSRLCMRCGACCFMLSITVSDEEAGLVHQNHGVPVDDFTSISEAGPFKGSRLVNLPCKFLKGKVLDHTFCSIHDQYRPEVCGSYHCKIAQKYSLGLISQGESLFWMRSALIREDVSIFNWIDEDQESDRLMAVGIMHDFADDLRKQGADQNAINSAVADQITPRYLIRSDTDHLVLSMHLDCFDRDHIDPKLFIDKEKYDQWEPEVQQFAVEITRSVLSEIRERFDKKESLLTRALSGSLAKEKKEKREAEYNKITAKEVIQEMDSDVATKEYVDQIDVAQKAITERVIKKLKVKDDG